MSLSQVLLGFLINSIVLFGLGFAAQFAWGRLVGSPPERRISLLLGAMAPAIAGYLAFWSYFAHPLLGRTFSWFVTAVALIALAGAILRRQKSTTSFNGRLLALTIAAGIFYLAALSIYRGPTFSATAQQRLLSNLPGDNEIPRVFAERLYKGESLKNFYGDWLSSDRPPLQTGMALLALPAAKMLHVDADTACATAGVWFQTLWIPALWWFVQWLGATSREAYAITAAATCVAIGVCSLIGGRPVTDAATIPL
jgi:hypothetical protein